MPLTKNQLDVASSYVAGAAITQANFGRKTIISLLTGLIELLYEDGDRKLDTARFLASALAKEREMRKLRRSA